MKIPLRRIDTSLLEWFNNLVKNLM